MYCTPDKQATINAAVDDIIKTTGKRILGVNDIRKLLNIGYNKAAKYLDGEEKITAYQLARKLN